MSEPASRFEVPADLDDFLDEIERRGWGDGLPIVPPTPDRVAACVAATGLDRLDEVSPIAPNPLPTTVEKVAVNAVMAGCRPEYMPVVLAAIRAMAKEEFNLLGVQSTTHPCAVLVIVSGPVAAEIGMNSGYGAFGPGNRANATIGRTVRLVLMNIGGARPGGLDRATQGSPAKYAYCVAENDAASPWPPLRESLGFRRAESTVTAVPGEAPHNINDHGSTNAESLLAQIAGTMATTGNNNVYLRGDSYLFLGPEHAWQLARSGFTRESLQESLFELTRVPHGRFGRGQLEHLLETFGPRELELARESIPLGVEPADIRILVVGERGRHSSWVPTVGIARSASEVVS